LQAIWASMRAIVFCFVCSAMKVKSLRLHCVCLASASTRSVCFVNLYFVCKNVIWSFLWLSDSGVFLYFKSACLWPAHQHVLILSCVCLRINALSKSARLSHAHARICVFKF
jgi:hypothetical protein